MRSYAISDPAELHRWHVDRKADAQIIADLGWLPAEAALESLKENWLDQWSRHLVVTNYNNRIARRRRKNA